MITISIRKALAPLIGALGFAYSAMAGAADPACEITPNHTVIAQGQAVSLSAKCLTSPATINWKINDTTSSQTAATTLTGDVPVIGGPTLFNIVTPITLGAGATKDVSYEFSITTTSDGDNNAYTPQVAVVVVKPISALSGVAGTELSTSSLTPTAAACGSANNGAVSAMPTGTAACAAGAKQTLAVTGTSEYSWTCASSNGGSDALCSAIRGFNVNATQSGGNGSIVTSVPVPVASGASTTIVAAPVSASYSTVFSPTSACGGSASGNSYTTGPITNNNCTITVSFSDVVNGNCGANVNYAKTMTERLQGSAGVCASGNPGTVSVESATGKYTWTCSGQGVGSSSASCSQRLYYTVTASDSSSANGSVSPATQDVAKGDAATITVTAADGYIATASGCSGTLSGSTYTTGVVAGNCPVTASFTQRPAGDPGRMQGSYLASANVLVVDQSFSGGQGTINYLPGCVNQQSTTMSGSGCALNNYYSATLYGGGTTSFSFTKDRVLAIRFRTTSNPGSEFKMFQLVGADGGNAGATSPRMWLSTTPGGAPISTAVTGCDKTSSAIVRVATGPGYCPVSANADYYLNIAATVTATPNPRFQLLENTDFY